ncbi:hypothetical protein GGR53DRAFT_509456 [Hypoxylon sp. FL1150]|nr:hypothetical protein GGR53DRAFT_509456 [Hypoxylon sp. FL1150]
MIETEAYHPLGSAFTPSDYAHIQVRGAEVRLVSPQGRKFLLARLLIDEAQGEEKDNAFIPDILLKVSFAAIHTSTATLSQLIFDLYVVPEYIEPLREELELVVTTNGEIDKTGFHEVTQINGIMKENQRFADNLRANSY